MKIKSLAVAFAVLVAGLLLHQSAEARGLTKADRAVINEALLYMSQLATILEKNANKPKALLAKLDKFIKVKGPKLRKLSAKMKAMNTALDDNAKAQVKKEYSEHNAVKRLQKAVMDAMMKQQDNKAFQEELMRLLMKLQDKPKAKQKNQPRK